MFSPLSNFLQNILQSPTKINQKGIAHLLAIVLAVVGIGVGLYLVQTRTNWLPSAQTPSEAATTAFYLTPAFLYGQDQGPISYKNRGEEQSDISRKPQSAPRNWIYPGELMRVDIRVSSDVDAANVFGANINFPADLLEVQSVDVRGGHQDGGGTGTNCPPHPHIMCEAGKKPFTQVDHNGCISSVQCVGESEFKHPKIESVLMQLIKSTNREAFAKSIGIEMKEGMVRVMIELNKDIIHAKPPTFDEYGFKEEGRSGNLVVGYINPDSILKLAESIDVSYISQPSVGQPEALGESTSLALANSAKKRSTGAATTKTTSVTVNTSATPPAGNAAPGCKIGGCSSQLCLNEEDPKDVSTCVWNEEYACYKTAKCERQKSGLCEWTITPDLQVCIEKSQVSKSSAPKPTPPNDQVRDYFIRIWLEQGKYDNAIGTITFAGGVPKPGIKTTPGQKPIMATIVLKAKKAGSAQLGFSDESSIIRDSDNKNILVGKNGLVVEVKETNSVTGDLDGDGQVGFKDFSMILSKWGSSDKRVDLNGDGKVSIFDFSIMLSKWSGRKKS
jgi:hypothetical protein